MNRMDKFSELLQTGESKTLEDKHSQANSKVYIRAGGDLRIVTVDHGLIDENRRGKNVILW